MLAHKTNIVQNTNSHPAASCEEFFRLKQKNQTQQQINVTLQKQLDDVKNTIAQIQSAMSQCCNSFSSSLNSSANTSSIKSAFALAFRYAPTAFA